MGQQPYQHLVDNQLRKWSSLLKGTACNRLEQSPNCWPNKTLQQVCRITATKRIKQQSSSGQGDLLGPNADSSPLPSPHDNKPPTQKRCPTLKKLPIVSIGAYRNQNCWTQVCLAFMNHKGRPQCVYTWWFPCALLGSIQATPLSWGCYFDSIINQYCTQYSR